MRKSLLMDVILYWIQAGASGSAGGNMQMNDYTSRSGQNIQIQLPNGNIMNIPVDRSAAPNTTKVMNISEEVNRSGVWKTVNIGNVLPQSIPDKPTCRNNRRREK